MGLFGLLLTAAPARALDYDQVDRKLINEPAYVSKAPKYALLLFGRDARVRVWVVADGQAVYVDRNGDGDITAKDEHFGKIADCRNIELADPDGGTRFVISGMSTYGEGNPPRPHLMANVEIKGSARYEQYCDAAMGDSPREAAIAHFHGPLTIGPQTISWKVPPKLALVTGEKPVDLRAMIGTMSAKHGCWVVVRTHNGKAPAFPKDVFPVVDIEFPSDTKGGPLLKERYPLDGFC
jgi:hypothetical protein